MSRVERIVGLLAAAVALMVPVGTASAEGGLTWETERSLVGNSLEGIEVAPSGKIYLAVTDYAECSPARCRRQAVVTRRHADGRPDSGFGRRVVFKETERGVFFAVDKRGRIVVSTVQNGYVVVKRFNSSGRVDAFFGRSGRTSAHCDCWITDVEVAGDTGAIVVTAEREQSGSGGPGSGRALVLTRFTNGGELDRRFHGGGQAAVPVPQVFEPTTRVRSNGAVLVSMPACCPAPTRPVLNRVSAKGRLDRQFAAKASSALAEIRPGSAVNLRGLIPRSGGGLDLIVNVLDLDFAKRGLVIRLRPDGSLERRFGDGGTKPLPAQPERVATNSNGRSFVLSPDQQGGSLALRVNAEGDVDRSFGVDGVLALGAVQVFGVEIEPQGREDAVIFEWVTNEGCRTACGPERRRLFGMSAGD